MADARVDELKRLLPQCLLHDWVRLGSRLVQLLRESRPPESLEPALDRLLAQARGSIELRERRRTGVPRIGYPPDLPITARKDEIVAAIRAHQVVIIAGETGSGKTTQIPKMCLEAGLGIEAKIGCTQPRRVAALSISQRIAEELNVEWGREVGCKIRFQDRSSPHTYIKLMTDGILLAETQGDPMLSEYNALILDEAHERSLNIDFLLGYLRGLLAQRNDLKLIVTSATIDTTAFSQAFGGAPIIEVSGRMYPVEVVYAPFDADSEERGEVTFIDAAVNATERVLNESIDGDVLIFLPGERDIREALDLLDGRLRGGVELIPLFGRLSAAEQQRVFAPSTRRKIVIATNIAETSLTIPGIRYVIDSGLARISHYNARTRTKRLPVEPISQNSARQRQGRAGRVREGVCIRLYSEEEFAERPADTPPEIQRANLAEVILRMRAFQLGEIETFPFLNPPTPAAIAGGYKLLQELGALDDARALTPLGRDLARLPIDPTLGRMLLQAQREHASRELLIIAAGLSIQDPRERPLDQKDAAAAAHKRFTDAKSDFLTLLNIWNTFHEQWEKLRTQNQRRRFCRANFLSYLRMREWQDLHAQLHEALDDLGSLRLNESNAHYDAIHRSILAGLLGHVACRAERNQYKAAGGRPVMLFPGSGLFDRQERRTQRRTAGRDSRQPELASVKQPEWIVAGELVETSQLFARTAAGINPQWIVEIAPHLCKTTHENPHWDAKAGRVLALEKTMFYGLEVQRRHVAYGNINATEATEIFLRSALVEEALFEELSDESDMISNLRSSRGNETLTPRKSESPHVACYAFYEHNRRIRHKIETWQTRVRRHDLPSLDDALFDFYAQRLTNVSSVHELNRVLREHAGEPEFLCVTEADLSGGRELRYDTAAFPDAVPVDGQPVAVSYAYAPGEERDGVTVKLPFTLAQTASLGLLEWAVPGLREEKIRELLYALPKALRKPLMPLEPKVAEIVRDFHPTGRSFTHDLGRFLQQRFGVAIPPDAWPADALPTHLRARVEIIGANQEALATGRDLDQLRQQLAQTKTVAEPSGDPPEWTRAVAQWERFSLSGWTFGDLPERVTVRESAELPLYAWPGLQAEEAGVSVRLFRSRELARRESVTGVQRLVETAIQRDLGWLQKDLRALAQFEPLLAGWMTGEELQTSAFENVKRHLLPSEPLAALTQAEFLTAVERARERLRGAGQQLIDQIAAILPLRRELMQRAGRTVAPAAPTAGRQKLTDFKQLGAAPLQPATPVATAASELAALLPKDFLQKHPFDRLVHLPRYLKALRIRAERAALNPLKDQERARQLAPYVEALRQLESKPASSAEARRERDEFRWAVEEFKVSLFAQELGTVITVSPKRLDQQLERARSAQG